MKLDWSSKNLFGVASVFYDIFKYLLVFTLLFGFVMVWFVTEITQFETLNYLVEQNNLDYSVISSSLNIKLHGFLVFNDFYRVLSRVLFLCGCVTLIFLIAGLLKYRKEKRLDDDSGGSAWA